MATCQNIIIKPQITLLTLSVNYNEYPHMCYNAITFSYTHSIQLFNFNSAELDHTAN